MREISVLAMYLTNIWA